MRTSKIVLWVTLSGWFMSGPAAAHPQHRSTARVEIDRNRGVLEVALRVAPDDLEAALEHRSGRLVRIFEKSADVQILRYLRDTFRVGKEGSSGRLRWIGRELEAGDLWLYFEVGLPKKAASVELFNRVFFELNAHQINVVRWRDGKKKVTASQSIRSTPLRLSWSDDGVSGCATCSTAESAP